MWQCEGAEADSGPYRPNILFQKEGGRGKKTKTLALQVNYIVRPVFCKGNSGVTGYCRSPFQETKKEKAYKDGKQDLSL